MTDTALTIITDALLDISVLADEETPTPSQAQGGLRKLNNMIDAWNTQDLLVYGAQSYVLQFTSNKGVYTIGPGGDFDIPRPTTIMSAYTRDTTLPPASVFDNPLSILNDTEWQELTLKGQIAQWPNWGVWFDYSYPLINAYVNPIPSSSQYSLVIWVEGLISNFTINDPIILAPGYKRALTANLGLELAPSYQVPIPDSLEKIAMSSIADLKVNNFQLNRLETGGGSQYDAPTNRVYIR